SAFNLIVGGTDSPWVQRLAEAGALDIPNLSEEGYIVRKTDYRGVPFLAVVGGGALGQAYGLFRLVETLRLDPESLTSDFSLQAEPAMTLRLISSPGFSNYPTPEDALRWGFNAVMVEPWPGLALYDGYDSAIFDPKKHPEDRAWVQANRERARQQIAAAKALHLKVVTMGDLFHLPRQALALYGAQVSAEDNPGLFCIARPKTQALLSYGLKEVLTDFPGIDAIMVRTGENYPLGPLAGNSPAQGSCGGLSYPQRINKVMEVVYNQVVEGSGKTYIQRAWDLGDNGTHARPEIARAALKNLEGKKGLMVSFKQTQTDFWRYNPVNPNLGGTAGDQMIELQMAREYEGKGAFPNYQGELFTGGAPEIEPRGGIDYAYQKGVRAVWVWAKGGGWGGPYPTSELWTEPNIYAAAHLAWDPSLSAEALAQDWATLRFGPQAAPQIASLLLKSDDAVLQTFYIGPASSHLGAWTPNNLWVRDDVIYGEPKMAELYQTLRTEKDFQEALEEKAQALRTIDSMVADLDAVRDLIPDHRLAEQALNTLHYETALAQTLGHYLGGMLYYHRWKDSGKTDNQSRLEALARLQDWGKAWGFYQQEIARLDGVASLYKDQ
ncbi:MAG: hypothetical protein Q8P59_14685, partial [Dehalococcoidia bacterium]|nr:hypothetical protein [Dehalococcoidia bacterium]